MRPIRDIDPQLVWRKIVGMTGILLVSFFVIFCALSWNGRRPIREADGTIESKTFHRPYHRYIIEVRVEGLKARPHTLLAENLAAGFEIGQRVHLQYQDCGLPFIYHLYRIVRISRIGG